MSKLCIRDRGYTEAIRARTGLLPDAYFSGTKYRWLLEHTPGARRRAERGELLCGTVDSWLLWNLTGGKVHASDYSNCCRTMLFDICLLYKSRGHLLKGMAKKSNVCTNSIPACQGMSKEKDGKKTPEETSSGVGSAFWD